MKKIFMRGLIALAPISLTLALLIWLYNVLEGVFSIPIKAILGPEYYYRGSGVLLAFVLIIVIGALLNTYLLRKLYEAGENLMHRIPFVKTLYSSVRDLMKFFQSDEARKQGYVVSFEIAGTRLIGLVTRESFDDLPKGVGEEGEIAVFLPMSYQIGGYMIMVPRSSVKRISMSVEEAMRFVVTAGMLSHTKKDIPK
ncbi:MAG: DUF502 domain-containing protein [Chlamydiae bacterium]|nr:DUF502 domain-containing protein [Chlamydiota bacterium]